MLRDKKASATGVTFIVLESLGHAVTNNAVSEIDLRDVLERFVACS